MEQDILRAPEVLARTGLSRTTIWRKVRAGTFPAPIELGANSIGWRVSEIQGWLESRNRRTYGAEEVQADRAKNQEVARWSPSAPPK